MNRTFLWASLALATASTLQAEDPLKEGLVHGVFKPSAEAKAASGPAIHPLEPSQRLVSVEKGATFRIAGQEVGEGLAFPILASPGAKEPTALAELQEDGGAFVAAVDLTGSGVSDLLVGRKDLGGWKVLTNGQRLPRPVQAFLVGSYEKDAESPRAEIIPADLRDFTVDQDLLAATGDFLGNGTEQLAYTRPGASMIWIVGAHGVTTMRADLKGIHPTPPGPRTHFLFPFKAAHKVQRTRLAYYAMGSKDLIRFVPKGMDFHLEPAPLKGHWERLCQAVLDWPTTRPATPIPAPSGQEGESKAAQ